MVPRHAIQRISLNLSLIGGTYPFALTETAMQQEEELEFSETSESEDSDEMTSDEEISKAPALKSSQTNEVSSQCPSEEHFTRYITYVFMYSLYAHGHVQLTLHQRNKLTK